MKLFKKRDFVILILLALTPTLFFYSAKTLNLVTGAAIYAEDAFLDVEQLALNHPLTRLAAPGSKICILVNEGPDSVSFNVDKIRKDNFDISEAEYKYCDTAENEDFIFEFLSYNSFKKQVNDNSCDSFKKGWGGIDYYFLVSRFVKPGGDIICSNEFKDIYCPAIKFCYTNEEINYYKLSCCSNYNTTEEASLYDELLAEGIDKGTTVKKEEAIENEVPAYEEPSPTTNYLIWILIPIIIIVLVGGSIAALKLLPKKPAAPKVDPRILQLQSYIYNTMRIGYSREQIYYYILQHGWPKDIVDQAFQNIYKPQ